MSDPYSAVSALIPASEPSLTMLADVIASETRLLQSVSAILGRQRRAVAEADMQAVEDSVFATHRVLATLSEARLRRHTLNRMFGAREDVRVTELEDLLGSRMTPALAQLRDELLSAARRLSEEVAVNRDLLRHALGRGVEHVHALADTPPASAYAKGGTVLFLQA